MLRKLLALVAAIFVLSLLALAVVVARQRPPAIDVSDGEAIRWITKNAAWALGIEERVGTLTAGKDADVVLWSGDPLSVYTRADRVYIDGVLRHDASAPSKPWSDFEAAP